MSKLCSIIVRTKNEERWIGSCLSSIYSQSYKNVEVIIVDNESTDLTVERVRQFPVSRVVSIGKYLPGAALNRGIETSSGEYIVCLSGHCIPVNERWLEQLVNTVEEDGEYAGVYGRQEPMAFSSSSDKRDLLLVFGLDRRVQLKDSFFHNANSIIRRTCWDEVPFDDTVTNIEDRIWGQEMINRGRKLVYEPEASVYHYHGIHHGGNEERANKVVRIIESMQGQNRRIGRIDPRQMEIVALIPIKGKYGVIGDHPQMHWTIQAACNSAYVTRVMVTTDDQETAEMAKELGAECPVLRSEYLSRNYVGTDTVLKVATDHLEELGIYPDLVVNLEETFPFREEGMIDKIIEHTLEEGFDTVIAATRASGSIWIENGTEGYDRLDSGDAPRIYKEKSFIGLKGLCCVTHTEFIRQERMLGNKVGLFEIDWPLSGFEVREQSSRKVASQLLESPTNTS